MAERWNFKGTPREIIEHLRSIPSKVIGLTGDESKEPNPLWLSDEEYDKIYHKVPRLCIDLLILTDYGVVLTNRSIEPFKGMWHLPGGGMKYKETVDQTIERLAKKELNIEAERGPIVGFMNHPEEEKLGFGWPVSFVFKVKVTGEISDSIEGRVGIFREIPENTIPSHKEFLLSLSDTF